jgi:hypothetical protein
MPPADGGAEQVSQIQAVDPSAADTGDVAFTLRARPEVRSAAPSEAQAAPAPAVQTKATPPGTASTTQAEPDAQRLDDSPALAEPAPVREKPAAADSGHAPVRTDRQKKDEASAPERVETTAPTTRLASHDPALRADQTSAAAPDRTELPQSEPLQPREVVKATVPAETPRQASVHEMKFEVTGGEQRVEVRLSERAGEVKMTVRTPDAPLADSLRDNLPSLSARLADNGLKSEVWHPAASSTADWRHTDSTSGSAFQETNSQSRQQNQQQQDDAEQRRSRGPQETAPNKQKGKDFAWLMSSLR